MKGLIIDTDGSIVSKEYGEPLYKTVGETVGGFIETVKARYLSDPFVMIVNEEGLLQKLHLNTTGSLLYGTHEHNQPIVGKIVIMREGMNPDGEWDILGLEPGDDVKIFNDINKLQSGANLTITRASAGDGYYDEGESAWDLEELKHPRADCTCRIAAREMLADGTTVLTIYISADSSIVPLREIGIYASDPDEGEILYASTNAGDYPDYLPPGTTATTVVRKYKVCIETGEAAEVTIENLSVAEVTREEFENHTHPQLHSHDNKGVLDGITAERVHDWDTAAGGGAVVADGSITMAKLASEVAAEVNKAHSHSNKSVLDTVTADVVSKKHEHDNKSVLDDIDSDKVTGWDAAVSHSGSTSNPHGVTKSQVGLGNVPNVTTNNQTPTYTTPSTPAELASGEKLSTAFGKIKIAISRLISHLSNTGNPHGVTAAQVGLGGINKFSTSPAQIGTWIDGTPVWRRAYDITFSSLDRQHVAEDGYISLGYFMELVSSQDNAFILECNMQIKMGSSPDMVDDVYMLNDREGSLSYYLPSGLDADDIGGVYGYIIFVTPENNLRN